MKKLTFSIILIMCIAPIFAQTLTLQEAMDKAVQHSYVLKNQNLNIAVAENERAKTIAQHRPTVNGNGDVRYNPILQTSILPGDVFGQPNAESQRIKFGTTFNILFSLEGNYKLYDPAYQTNVAINEAQTALEKTTLRKNTAQVKLDAATAYYEVLLQQTQVNLATDRLQRAQDLLDVSKTRQEAGAALPVDVQKSDLDVQNAAALRTQAQNALERSRLNLARQMGIALENLPPLNTDLLHIQTDTLQMPTINAAVLDAKPEILEQQQQLQITQLQLQKIDKQYLPSINLYGNLSAQHLSDNLAVWERWFPFAYAGAQLTMPLYDGNLKARNKETYQLQLQINQNNLASTREDLTYELQSAAIDLKNAISQLRDAEQNLQNAKDVQSVDQLRYKEGTLLFADFRNTEFSLREAEINFLSASQNYLLARLRWLNATGNL